jgi:ABC-type uncharacterized transport system involved in gliding motility auxiliary subunit
MVSYLELLPIDWNMLKRTKIGKAVNSALKANLFDSATLERTGALVNRWKLMVKELKSLGESEANPQNSNK